MPTAIGTTHHVASTDHESLDDSVSKVPGNLRHRLTQLWLMAVCSGFVVIPFLVAIWGAPAGFVFRGTLEPSGDESQYLAAVRMGMSGDWLWHDPYMAHTPPPILMYPMYLLAGHVARLLSLDIRGGFVLMHLLAVVCLVSALWHLGMTVLDRSKATWFVLFGLLVGGPYWLVAILTVFGRSPVRLSHVGTPGLSGFTSLVMGAHEPIGIAGQLMVFAGLLRASRNTGEQGLWGSSYAALGMILVGLTFPVLLPLTLSTTVLFSVWWLISESRCALSLRTFQRQLGITLVITVPGILFAAYYYLTFNTGAWSAGQFKSVPTIPFIERLIIWGMPLLFAAWSWSRTSQTVRPLAVILAIWACCGLIGAELPFWQADRYISGLNVGFGALCALGILGTTWSARTQWRWLVFLGLGAISQYLFLITALQSGNASSLYATAGKDRAMHWLGQHASPSDIVLAPFGFGNAVPIVANIHVVAGHSVQTLDYSLRLRQLNVFYGEGSRTDERLSALRATGATLVVFDPSDLENGTFNPAALPTLRIAFQASGVEIFWVSTTRSGV